jgi:SAM-dependent methyltransferase
MAKRYDRRYFERWYRDAGRRLWSPAEVERKVRMVLGVAEFLLDRPVRSVLDVGCGEGTWQPVLRRLRPAARYTGVDASRYAVARYGRRRNIRRGEFARLGEVGLGGTFDLVVCCDVLHYLPTAHIARGLAVIHELAGGPVYLEAYTAEDDIEGDDRGFHRRRAATYRRLFSEAGFVPCGMMCYLTRRSADLLVALERRRR